MNNIQFQSDMKNKYIQISDDMNSPLNKLKGMQQSYIYKMAPNIRNNF